MKGAPRQVEARVAWDRATIGEDVTDDATSAPMFIIAAPGSHSAQIAAMIGCHPACFATPELNLFAGSTLEDISLRLAAQTQQTQFHGLLRLVSYLYAGEQSLEAVEMARRWMMRRSSAPAAQIFEELRAKIAPLRLVDPSRAHSAAHNLPRLLAAYPDALLVRLTRDDEDKVFASEQAAPLKRLQETRAGLLSFLDGLPEGQCVTLSIDEVEKSPAFALAALCRRIGVSDDEASVEAMLHPERSPFAGFGPIGANLGNDPDFLRRPRIAGLARKPRPTRAAAE